MADGPQPRKDNATRAIAWTALFLSMVAVGASGYMFLKTHEGGELFEQVKTNVKTAGVETRKVVEDVKAKFGDDATGDFRWDKVRDRIDRIEGMVKTGDNRAAYYIEVLENDLDLLSDYTAEKSSTLIEETKAGLRDARGRLANDENGAVEKLKELSGKLSDKVQSFAPGDEKSERPPEDSK